MNRRTKIIVSVVGIFIVLLALVGITYAYFLTQVQGNTNDTSIKLTTANLKLEYSEDTNVIQGTSDAMPGYSVEKIFYATNKGDSLVEYVVTLENVVNQFSRKQDLVYTITCESTDSTTGEINGNCNEITTETQYPETAFSPLLTNNIEVGTTHKYILKITYKEAGVDQSVDMGKTFKGLVNIRDKNEVYAQLTPSEQTLLSLGLTAKSGTPDFSQPASETSGIYSAEDNYGTSYYFRGNVTNNNVIFGKEAIAEGKYCYIQGEWGPPFGYIDTNTGIIYEDEMECSENTETYCDNYYPEHCYDTYDECDSNINEADKSMDVTCQIKIESISYKDMNWKIIRINGDGTLRLISTSPVISVSNYGEVQYISSSAKNVLDTWYSETLLESYDQFVAKDTMFCNDLNYTTDDVYLTRKYYDFKSREMNPSLYCNPPKANQNDGETQLTISSGLIYPIALITADELVMSGLTREYNNSYLSMENSSYTMTPLEKGDDSFTSGYIYNNNKLSSTTLNPPVEPEYAAYFYPVINLLADTAKNLVWDSTTNTYVVNE